MSATLNLAQDDSFSRSEIILSNARIVLGDEVISGHLRVRDGVIYDIDRGATKCSDAIDLDGDYLLPGLLDVHTDHFEKHIQPRASMTWNPLSAAITYDTVLCAAGITTVLDSLVIASSENNERRSTLPLMIDGLKHAADQGLLRTDHYLHLRCDLQSDDVIEQATPYLHEPRLKFVTLMDDGPLRSPERFRRNRRQKGMADLDIEAAIAAGREHGDKRLEVVRMAKEAGIHLASHDDMTSEHIAESVALGLAISEFPISLEAARAARDAGMTIIAGAPNIVAGRSHIGNVSGQDLARAGLIDIVCSDYIPASLLHALWRLTDDRIGLSLPVAIAMGSSRPAGLFGFSDRGMIAPGYRADLARVAVYDGVPLVRNTWSQGKQVI